MNLLSPARLACRGSLALAAFAAARVFAQPVVSVSNPVPATAVAPGQSVMLGVSASGTGLTYQWMLNGNAIPGATGATYSMMAGAADNGMYQVAVTDAGGTTTTTGLGTLGVMASDARLMNFSARGVAGSGANVMITGFASSGGPTAMKNVMIRGMGPSLAGMMGGMMGTGVLSNPMLTVFDGQSRPMGTDMGWQNAPTAATGSNTSPVAATFMPATMSMMNAMGAFAPTTGATDSALLMRAAPGLYSAVVSGAMPGVALAECYDADAAEGVTNNTARLINMSARANVGTGANVLIAGFVIGAGPSGSDTTVMIRAMGPGLAPFGMTGLLSKPVLTLNDGTSHPIATNQGWSNLPVPATGTNASPVHAGIEPATAALMNSVGAFPAMAGSADCAIVATLPPGSYSAVVSGATDASGQPLTGIALVEVYEIR